MCVVKMDDTDKMQEKSFDDLCEDIVNISRVLPNLTPLDLQTELLDLRNDPDRVATILRKHFTFYNEDRENQMSQDIKMIKRVLPNVPIVRISKDLTDFGQKKNRVQLVLKKYFGTPETNPCKRSLDADDSVSSKIMKLEESDAAVCTFDHLIPPNSPININQVKTEPSTEPSNINISSRIETPETTSQEFSEINNSVAIKKDDNSFELSSEQNEENTSMMSCENDNSDEKVMFWQIINKFYPDLSLKDMDIILTPLGINVYDYTCGDSTNFILNEILNYFESKPVKTETKDTNILVKTDTQSTGSSSTEEYDIKTEIKDTNIIVKTDTQSIGSSSTEEYDIKDELTDFFQAPNECTSVLVKQEVAISDYTDKNLSLINEICRGINNDDNDDNDDGTLNSKVAEEPDKKCDVKPFINIVSGTDNWVKSALVQPKNNPNTSSTQELDDIGKSSIVKKEKFNKRSPCSTVTSASVNIDLEANPFASHHLVDGQVKEENVMNYTEYGVDLSQEEVMHCKNIETWLRAPPVVEIPVRTIERPPRDNLKSSLGNRNNFAGGYASAPSAATTATHGKNFVQYLENRNDISNAYTRNVNIDGLYVGNEVNFPIPNPYLTNNQSVNNQSANANANINNNIVEEKLNMSRRRSNGLTKQEESEVKALLCELGNGKCNACKKCLKNRIALKVRNDLFRRNAETSGSSEDDEDDVVLVNRIKEETPPPVIELCESSSSDSGPLPGTSTGLQPNENHPFFYKVMEMFPDICPEYLRTLCSGKDHSSSTLDFLISTLLEGQYKRRKRPASPAPALEFEDQYRTLVDLFPDADPTYLQHHCERLFEHQNEYKEFVASLLEHKNYPSKEQYLKKMKLSAQQKQYTTEFDVKKFLEVIPNPDEFFQKRTVKINFPDQDYALTFLKNHFCHLTIKDITTAFRDCGHSVVKASMELDKLRKNMKSKRKLYPLTNCLNIPLLQEIAYVKNKKEILHYMEMREQEKIQNRQFAKAAGLLKTCECCYDDEVMPEEMACCENGHVFCKECVKKGCEVKIGEGKTDFLCLTMCDAQFSLQVLQSVLTPKVFSKMAQRKQLEEVKSAGIEDLEFCPFCDFATIPAPGDKLFRCLNSDCMKESCRECKEPSHIPLRCDEVEKENDVKLRTYIEDKMTEALVRKCYKCGMKFIKEEGCNKMTCSCGAMMCYVCNQPVKDYKHFNGQGGDQYHLCPLYSDTHKLHMDAVKLSAENAKKELGIANNQLKIDPTANLDQHYKRLANRNPQNLPPGMEQLNPQHIHIRIQEFHLARR